MNKADKYLRRVITAMMIEDTGVHFLDSGGTDGRAWQRNRKTGVNWAEPVTIDDGEYCRIPVHRFLDGILELDSNTTRFNRCLAKAGGLWPDDAVEHLRLRFDLEKVQRLENTYNYDTDLSQDLLFRVFDYEGDQYVALSIHGGADPRGGYTRARVFKIADFDYWVIGMRCSFYSRVDEYDYSDVSDAMADGWAIPTDEHGEPLGVAEYLVRGEEKMYPNCVPVDGF